MKRNDVKDLANKQPDELRKLLVQTRKDLFDIQMDMKLGKVKNTRSLFWKRKEIAYILTQIQRKEHTQNG